MAKIREIALDSIASEGGIEAGDELVSVNGTRITDILEYKFLTADEVIELKIKKKNGNTEFLTVYNEYFEDLGIIFEHSMISNPKCCANKCIFCFIDQLPGGMRETLYFKDDDTRLSFLQGNYITLTNLCDKDIDKIIKMRISPVNVSVHSTDAKIRSFMLGNKRAGNILAIMRKMADNHIVMNCQIVVCPGINDEKELARTISDLSEMFPYAASLSVVPVGLTKFRDGLFEILSVKKNNALNILSIVEEWQNKCVEKFGSRFVFASDEIYITAQKPIPSWDDYEDFPQLENGVGMMASTKKDFLEQLKQYHNGKNRTVSIATGVISYAFIKELCENVINMDCMVYPIINHFFGPSITVAGLVTGQDLISQLKDKKLGEYLLIPSSMLRAGTNMFLDDVTIDNVESELDIKVLSAFDGADFAEKLFCGGVT